MTERLEVICGPMFSGKTTELGRLVERQGYARKKVQVFKPAVDDRFGKPDKAVTHNGVELDALPVETSLEILSNLKPGTKLVAIDEAQFFDENIVEVVTEICARNIRVLVAGLPNDFRGEPFGSMPALLAKADYRKDLTAVCTQSIMLFWACGQEATRTQRLVNGRPARYTEPVVLVGAKELYAARCAKHHRVPGRPVKKNA